MTYDEAVASLRRQGDQAAVDAVVEEVERIRGINSRNRSTFASMKKRMLGALRERAALSTALTELAILTFGDNEQCTCEACMFRASLSPFQNHVGES